MTTTLPPEIESVLVDEATLATTVDRLAAAIQADYAGRQPVLVGALTGAVVFASDLMRRLALPLQIDFVAVSSYGDQAVSGGEVRWSKALSLAIADRDVLLVEDIVDTGLTLRALQAALLTHRPASLATAALLNKPSRRQVDVTVEYVGLDIPDQFVVGYGLDYAQRFRHLPFVGVLRPEVYRRA